MRKQRANTEGLNRNDQQTSLPGLPTWPRVYLLVAASFILWVVLLRLLTVLFA